MKKLLLILLCFLFILSSCKQEYQSKEKTSEKASSKYTEKVLLDDEYTSDKDCYILNVSAVKTKALAREKVEKLKNDGYESGFLWIPNFSSLSGAEYYSVFIGPFATQLECEIATENYRKIDNKAYGLLVSKNSERVEIRGVGKVKKTYRFNLNKSELINLMNQYYRSLIDEDFNQLEKKYSDQLYRYHSLFSISKHEALKDHERHLRSYKIKSVEIISNSFSIVENKTEYNIQFELDYRIIRRSNNKKLKYILNVLVVIDANGKIKSIYDEILKTIQDETEEVTEGNTDQEK